jgi:hypothetical protein
MKVGGSPHHSRFTLSDNQSISQPLLCVNIDAEEEFEWGASFSRQNTSVQAIDYLHHGQTIFKEYALRPTYLVDYPVITSAGGGRLFAEWAANGECQVGAQLHPWVNPPHEEVICPYNSFACNLSADLEGRKLEILSDAIERAIGDRPRIYKAGRYGIDIGRENGLAKMGYLVDTSVVPYRSYAGIGGGPDFFDFPDRPFWTTDRGQILYLPITQNLVGPLRPLTWPNLNRVIFSGSASRLHIPGILARLNLLERIMLTPEGVTVTEMSRLLRSMIARGYRIFCLSLHSTTFMPGCTPYTTDAADLEKLLRRIRSILEVFFSEIGGRPTTPLELRQLLRPIGH